MNGVEGYVGAAIVISAYLFQIGRLAITRNPNGVSVHSYLLWAAASALMLVHALGIDSPVFIVLTGSHLAACVIIAALAVLFGRVRSNRANLDAAGDQSVDAIAPRPGEE